MLKALLTVLFCVISFGVGLCVGVWQAPQLKTSQPARIIQSTVAKLPWAKSTAQEDPDSPFEEYQYPVIKWRPKALADAKGAIGRLWTTFEANTQGTGGVMKYKLTLFKATNKSQREVQLLDSMGFKIMQFSAGDFHSIGDSDQIVESRDSVPCSEDQYRKAQDYIVHHRI